MKESSRWGDGCYFRVGPLRESARVPARWPSEPRLARPSVPVPSSSTTSFKMVSRSHKLGSTRRHRTDEMLLLSPAYPILQHQEAPWTRLGVRPFLPLPNPSALLPPPQPTSSSSHQIAFFLSLGALGVVSDAVHWGFLRW